MNVDNEYYKHWRSFAEDSPLGIEIEKESKEYYNAVRRALNNVLNWPRAIQ